MWLLVCLSVVVAWKHNTLGRRTQFIHAEAVERVSLSSILSVTLMSSLVLKSLDIHGSR